MGCWLIPNITPERIENIFYPRLPLNEEVEWATPYWAPCQVKGSVIKGHRDSYKREGKTEAGLWMAAVCADDWSAWWVPRPEPGDNVIRMGYRAFHEMVKGVGIADILEGSCEYENWFAYSLNTGRIWVVPTDMILSFMGDIENPIQAACLSSLPTYDICTEDVDARFLGVRDEEDDDFQRWDTFSDFCPDPDMSCYKEVYLV